MKVIFSHGKESGPWGSKIKAMADMASERGFDHVGIVRGNIVTEDLRCAGRANAAWTQVILYSHRHTRQWAQGLPGRTVTVDLRSRGKRTLVIDA